MPVTLDLPESADLMMVLQNLLPVETRQRELLKRFPIEATDAAKVMWDQMDDFLGLQQVRGIGGHPGRVKHTGHKRYVMEPGAYGEFEVLGEKLLTEMAEPGTLGEPLNLDEYIGKVAQKLTQREFDRIETTWSALLRTGTFTVVDDTGAAIHTDKFAIQSFTPGVPWDTFATATPLKDLRGFIQTAEGQGSFSFGPESELLCNRKTMNDILGNLNANDLFGLRGQYGATVVNSLDDLNKILVANDLPRITVYNRWFKTDAGVRTYIIPDKFLIWLGKRPNNERIGAYKSTLNVNRETASDDPSGTGESTQYGYFKIIDRGANSVPREIEIHRGHNGGPALFFPGAVAAISY
jgi:hypothetical protein